MTPTAHATVAVEQARIKQREALFMEHLFTIASLWLGLAVLSAIIAYHLHISIALVEI